MNFHLWEMTDEQNYFIVREIKIYFSLIFLFFFIYATVDLGFYDSIEKWP